jgi:hypothetical protein
MRSHIIYRYVMPVSLALAGVGCFGGPLTEGGAHVRTVTSDPPLNCQELGSVKGVGYGADDAKDDARNKTAKMGGNVLRLEGIGQSIGLVGTAFKCPAQERAL